MKLEEALGRYELATRASGYSANTIAHVKRCTGFFAEYLGGIEDVGQVSADDLRRFLSVLRDRQAGQGMTLDKERKLSLTSINTYARAIKSFWSWMEREGIVRENTLASVPAPKKAKTIPEIYSESELRTLFGTVHGMPRERAMVEIILDSGIRLGELSSLKVTDVEFKTGRLRVLGKGNKERFAYFSPATAESIGRYMERVRPKPSQGDYVFLTEKGHPLSGRAIQTILERTGRKAGLSKRLSPHKLRHTYATLALKYGGNLEYIRITLGHTDIKTTSQAYLNVADSDIAVAHLKFSPMANLMSAQPKESPVTEDKGTAVQEILRLEIRHTLRPVPGEPSTAPTKTYDDFKMDIKANEVFIESIQVFTTDPIIEYRLFLFAVNAPDDLIYWDYEDLIHADMTKKRIYTYSPNPPLAYRDYAKSNTLHAGICIGQRPLRFDLLDENQKAAYYNVPVSYTITLKYRLK
jgi:site-specific recombinase XerD